MDHYFRIRLQFGEALGPLNRWFCSEMHGREIADPELLLRHYIKSGGAKNFARRYDQAMGTLNRWYCSEFFRRDIRDPEILWEYYMKYVPAGVLGNDPRKEADEIRSDSDLSIAC